MRLPRPLHPGAWWLWALGLAAAASRTTNPLLLGLVIAVAGYVVAAWRTPAPWARSYAAFLRLGLAVIVFRVLVTALFGAPQPGTVLLELPQVPLPGWALGVRIGGPVTTEALAAAAYEGLRLATLLACVGAANALVNPSRLLRCLPPALYEVGVAAVVAMTFAPQLLLSVRRVRTARRLRGRPDRGLRGLRGVAMPVLHEALERSLELAASMDARGYGRRAVTSAGARRLTAALLLGGLAGVCVGMYGLLDSSSPALLGLPALAAGVAAAGAGLLLAGRRTVRTRYRPDPWSRPEWAVSACGATAAASVIATGVLDPAGLLPSTSPLAWPPLPWPAALGVLAGFAPAWLAPPLPAAERRPAAHGVEAKGKQ